MEIRNNSKYAKRDDFIDDYPNEYLEDYRKEKRARRKAELELRKLKLQKKVRLFDSFMKVLVGIIVLHGLLCVTASYVLAYKGYVDALENLSSTMVHEIMGPVITYGFTKMVENVSKYNDWIDKYLKWKYQMKFEEDSPVTPAETTGINIIQTDQNYGD